MFDYPTIERVTEETKPGYYRIEHEAYHASPGISSSEIKNALVSYGYYKAKKEDDSTSPALEFGKAFHMAILEPGLFEKTYVIEEKDKFNKRTKQGREDYAQWVADLKEEGAEIIKEQDRDLLTAMAANVQAHPLFAGVKGQYQEVACVARCPHTGLLVKCKPDSRGHHILDFKTYRDAVTPANMLREINNRGYHISAAHYQDTILNATGEKLPFVIAAVEKIAPHGVAFYELSDELIEEGRTLVRAGLDRIKRWEKNPPKCHYGEAIHVLHPNAITMYNTRDTLQMIEDNH